MGSKSPRLLPSAVAIPPALLVMAGCGAGESIGDVVRADSAGVEIVTSTAVDRPLYWTFEEQFRLGGADEGAETFASVSQDEVRSDDRGNLYVLDGMSHRVVVFGPDGTFLREMGSQGGGPGEFGFPITFDVAPDGRVSVFDISRRALVSFGPGADLLPQVPFPHYTAPGIRRHFEFLPGGEIVAAKSVGDPSEGTAVEVRVWHEAIDPTAPEPDTLVLARLEMPEASLVDLGCAQLLMPPLFSPVTHWDAANNRIATTTGGGYRVDVFSGDGTLLRSIRRPLPRGATTERHARAEVGDGMTVRAGAGECSTGVDEVVEGRGYVDALPAIRNLLIAASGEIWVQRLVPGGGRNGNPQEPIDVFDPAGAYVGTLPEGTSFPLLLLPDGRIVFREVDALDIQRLVVTRLQR